MTPTAIRRDLERRREQIRERLALPTLPGASGPGDEADEATDRSERVVAFASREQQLDTLKAIERALERLDAGRFGLCEICTGRIGEARLKAMPWAARCRECQGKIEDAQEHERPRERRKREDDEC